MSAATFSFPVVSFRKIVTPFEKSGLRNYVIVVDVSHLPDLRDWRRINVRDAKLTGSLPREIRDSFLSNLDTFVFLSRGMVMAVDGVKFDNQTKDRDSEGEITLHLSERRLHGLLDGGHNYQIIQNNRDTLAEQGKRQFVKIELIEGFDKDDLVKLVDARNSSNQVRDESLMELDRKFEPIKKILRGKSYLGKIAFKEFELDEEGYPKPIDIREVVSLLTTFDRDHFDDVTHPINAYRSKAACLKHFRDNPDSFEKIYHLLPDILVLWDEIHMQLPTLYNAVRGETGDVTGGRFGRLTGVVHLKLNAKPNVLDYTDKESRYVIPTGLKYPILGAFRALLKKKGTRYEWGLDPCELLQDALGKKLANTIGEFALDAQNPSKTGKSQVVWQSCYQSAELAYLRR